MRTVERGGGILDELVYICVLRSLFHIQCVVSIYYLSISSASGLLIIQFMVLTVKLQGIDRI